MKIMRRGVLTSEEQARFEGYSRNFYQEFFVNNNQFYQKPNQHQIKLCTPEQQTPPNELVEDLPTDDDLEDLLKDVSSEESELNKVFGNNNPVENDVSLSDALVYTNSNLTELQDLQDSCNQVNLTASSVVSSSQSETLFNDTDVISREQWQASEVSPNEVFPQSNYVYIPMQNDSAQSIISNGQISYDHSYSGSAQPPMSPLSIGTNSNGRQQQTQTSPSSVTVTATPTERYNPYAMRHSFSDSNTDSSSQCSRMSSESPRYNSESSSSHESRFYGKLIPSRESRFDRSRSPHSSIKIARVMPMSNGQRKRGRQSKDEQLATDHGLPVSASQISEMSLSELQQVLKNDGLSEYQRQLIRKIRRRGKNKVAARTCRQRRTDRHDKVMNIYQ
uniref:BZIP domain-containing protein n=1 Tax=Caenorhabditis tropicalis TaxID=1561998 RepID=A0A1I7T5A1_9PELO